MEKSKKIRDHRDMDRLSELPDPVIDCIFSYLPSAAEIIRTKVLSKRWARIPYSLIRTVCLDEWKFNARKSSLSKGPAAADDGTTFESYFDGFMKSLHENKVCIKKFELRLISNSGKHKDHIVNRWMKVAIDSSVEEISLLCGPGKDVLTFPASAFEAKSLKSLRLDFKIDFPDGLSAIPISWICLKRLDLSALLVSQLHYIISHCPKLEELLLSNVHGVSQRESQLTISHPNVTYINIRQSLNDWMAYDVEAPRLERLALWIPVFVPFRLTASRNLRFLDIMSCSTPALEAFMHDVVPNLTMLETMHLHSRLLRKFKVRSCSLQVINWHFDATPESFDIDAPNLRRLYLSSLNWDPIRCMWFGNLRGTLSKLPMCKILYIKCCSTFIEEHRRILEDLGPCLWHRVLELDQLILDVDASCLISFFSHVASLFLHCRPKFLYFGRTTLRPEHLQLFRQLLTTLPGCCTVGSFKCWRHYLNDVHEISCREIEATETCCYDPYYAQSLKAHDTICLKLDWEW